MDVKKRREQAVEAFKNYPERFPEERRGAILEGRFLLGMAPVEAHMTGGAFTYQVIADEKVWPPNSDPIQVMWAQSIKADDSKIIMRFEDEGLFRQGKVGIIAVTFERGLAVKIEKVEGKN
jgi:hypothetical protein